MVWVQTQNKFDTLIVDEGEDLNSKYQPENGNNMAKQSLKKWVEEVFHETKHNTPSGSLKKKDHDKETSKTIKSIEREAKGNNDEIVGTKEKG